jgi:hypothetical protein
MARPPATSFPALPAAAGLGVVPSPSASPSGADDPNRQDRKNAFLDSQGASDSLGSMLHQAGKVGAQYPSGPGLAGGPLYISVRAGDPLVMPASLCVVP